MSIRKKEHTPTTPEQLDLYFDRNDTVQGTLLQEEHEATDSDYEETWTVIQPGTYQRMRGHNNEGTVVFTTEQGLIYDITEQQIVSGSVNVLTRRNIYTN